MPATLLTLTTDFGTLDSYVAQMKGVLLTTNPQLQIVDITHAIPPQNILRAAMVLDEIVDVYPRGTIHLVVIDPEVGSDRPIVAVEMADQRFVAPDNGVLGLVARRYQPRKIIEVRESRFWRKIVSDTFHGRDIMAPTAGHWSLGINPDEFGPRRDEALQDVSELPPTRSDDQILGLVRWIDGFGNLITNIPMAEIAGWPLDELHINIGGARIRGISRIYSQYAPQQVLALIGSSGYLEIAVNQGNASSQLQLGVGAQIQVALRDSQSS